jgi:ferritin
MIGSKTHVEMNKQIQIEMESSYLYLAMATYMDDLGFDGMSNWFRVQAQEELAHAVKFMNHLRDRGAKVTLAPLGLAKTEWASPREAFEEAYAHEQFITARIHTITATAQQENDYTSMPMLNWFIEEQIEEEASASKIAQQLKLVGDNGQGLLMLDRELATRAFVYPPTALQGA